MNLGVIILCPNVNYGTLRFTAGMINAELNCPYLAVVPDKVYEEDVNDLKKYSPVFRGGKTVLSMINEGMKKLNSEWKLVIMSGSNIKYGFWKKYLKFLKTEKDILYSVLNRKHKFDEASINGFLIHDKAFKDIGCFPEEEYQYSKLCWASNALDKDYKFKAIVGVRL